MKKLIFLSFLSLLMVSCNTSKPNYLGKMNKKDRNEYMINLSKEVILTFGPGYYREYKKPIISSTKRYIDDDIRPEVLQSVGRKYYTLTFLYDPAKEKLDWDFAAEVDIWQDTGEPMGVTFGNGYGKTFVIIPYKEVLRMPDKKVIPYQGIPVDPFLDNWE